MKKMIITICVIGLASMAAQAQGIRDAQAFGEMFRGSAPKVEIDEDIQKVENIKKAADMSVAVDVALEQSRLVSLKHHFLLKALSRTKKDMTPKDGKPTEVSDEAWKNSYNQEVKIALEELATALVSLETKDKDLYKVFVKKVNHDYVFKTLEGTEAMSLKKIAFKINNECKNLKNGDQISGLKMGTLKFYRSL